MIPPPIVLGLTLCEKVIVEEGTRNVTLVSTFTKMVVEEFPSPLQGFNIYALLTDGLGNATIDVVATHLETDEVIYTFRNMVHFPDRLVEALFLLRVNGCSFPAPGRYQFTLLVDGEWVAQRHLQVAAREDIP